MCVNAYVQFDNTIFYTNRRDSFGKYKYNKHHLVEIVVGVIVVVVATTARCKGSLVQ